MVVEAEHGESLFGDLHRAVPGAVPRAVPRLRVVAGVRRAGGSVRQHGALQEHQHHQQEQPPLR